MSIDKAFSMLINAEESIAKRRTEIDNLESDFRRKATILKEIIRSSEEAAEFYRNEIMQEMEQDGLIETEISMFKVRRKKCTQSVVIEDEAAIPGNYIVTKTPKATTAPDKVLIGKLLRAGHEIAGARLSDEKYELEIKGK